MGAVLREVDSNVGSAEGPPHGRSTAADVVGFRLREQVAELRYQDPLVREDVPDSVHKMRVATRRLRGALATFRPLLERQRTEPLRDELKWIAGVLGAARDVEVQHQLVAALIADEPYELVIGPVAHRVDRDLGDAYRLAHERSIEAMQSERYFTLIDDLDALVANPLWTPLADQKAADVLPARVSKEFDRVGRHVTAVDVARERSMRDERLHEVRKAAKRARYAAEPLIPMYGHDAARFTEAFEHVQTVLGDYHDAVVTQPLLRQLAVQAHQDGDNAFTYGRLHSRLQARAADLRVEFNHAWSQANHKERRSWLA
jgi:CHAD domain-containing protein